MLRRSDHPPENLVECPRATAPPARRRRAQALCAGRSCLGGSPSTRLVGRKGFVALLEVLLRRRNRPPRRRRSSPLVSLRRVLAAAALLAVFLLVSVVSRRGPTRLPPRPTRRRALRCASCGGRRYPFVFCCLVRPVSCRALFSCGLIIAQSKH